MHTEDLKPVLASIQEAVIVAQPDGTIALANPATELITGLLPDDIVGRRLQETLRFQCLGASTDFLPKALEGLQAVALGDDCTLTQLRGAVIPVAAVATPLYTAAGDYAGIVLVIRDRTEENKLKRRQYEFLSFVSHQLRQPMGQLRWGLETILGDKERLSAFQQELLADLLKTIVQFVALIGDLIDISRFESGEIEFKHEAVDMRELGRESIQAVRGLAMSQNVTLALVPESRPGTRYSVMGDRDRLRDVLTNLLTNAIRYNRPRGTVTVSIQAADEAEVRRLAFKSQGSSGIMTYLQARPAQPSEQKPYLVLAVADTGLGIPEDEQGHIFENFFRARNVIAKGVQGSGLGLFIVKSIMERLGGRVFFESKENVGTTFYAFLPVA